MKKIGIPKTLFYYKHPVLWESFFRELGYEVVLSDDTNRKILDESLRLSDSESCLAVKLLAGHIKDLSDKCDLIFVPKLASNKRKYFSCPKFLVLPYLARLFSDYKKKVIISNFNVNYSPKIVSLFLLGFKLSKNPFKVLGAAFMALKEDEKEKEGKLASFSEKIKKPGIKLLIISHPYIINDRFMSFNIFKRLEELGAVSLIIDEVPYEDKDTEVKWDFANEFLNSLDYILEKNIKIDGVIQISNFSCGIDSIMVDLVKEKIRESDMNYLNLIVDEHTGEAGIVTRLEAFVDSIKGAK